MAVTVVVTVLTVLLLFEPAPATFRMPPSGADPGGDVLVVAFLASKAKAASVLPVVGALIAATMPDWQWLPVGWPQ